MAKSFPLQIVIQALDKFSTPFAAAQNSLDRFHDKVKTFGQSVAVNLSLPAAALGGGILKEAAGFEAALNKLQAAARPSAKELALLKEQAIDLGRGVIGPVELTDGMTAFAQAGFNAKQILEAMPAAIRLGVAGNIGLQEAVRVSTETLAQFKLEAKDLPRVADLLTYTANATNTDVSLLGEALKNVGTISGAYKIPIQDTIGSLGVLANVGLKAERGGTALKIAIQRMIAPTGQAADVLKKMGLTLDDVSPVKKGLTGSLATLAKGFDKIKDPAEKARAVFYFFGAEAAAGAEGMRANAGAIDELIKKLGSVGGYAEETAGIMSQGLIAQLKELRGAFTGLAVQIGDTGILSDFTKLVKKITDLVGLAARVQPRLLAIAGVSIMIAAALGPLIIGLALVVKAFSVLSGAALLGLKGLKIFFAFSSSVFMKGLLVLRGAVFLAAGAFRALFLAMVVNPLVLAGILAIGGAAFVIIRNWETLKKWFNEFLSFLSAQFDMVLNKVKQLGAFLSDNKLTRAFGALGDVVAPIITPNPIGLSKTLPATTLAGIRGASPAQASSFRSMRAAVQGGTSSVATSKNEAEVTVKFQNAPAGTRVVKTQGNVPLKLDMGYQMVTP